MKSFAFVLILVLLAGTCFGEEAELVGPALQDVSVNVKAGATQGSGTLIVTKVGDEWTTWVLTAHHVVDGLREVKEVIGPEGRSLKQVRYRDAEIIQERVYKGRTVGGRNYDAKVINVDPQRDIALLQARIDKFTDDTIGFYLGDAIQQPGVEVYHCGAPGGKEIGGTASLTDGIVSRIGVRIPDFGGSEHGLFDQVTCPAIGGSSGGLVALRSNGEWIGMITLGLRGGDSFHWVVPIRSVKAWAKEVGVEWLLDPSLPRPSKAEVGEILLELDAAGHTKSSSDKPKESVHTRMVAKPPE